MTKKVVFVGCSFTAGNGWDETVASHITGNVECKNSSNLWVNLCATQISSLNTLDVINAGQGGASNTIVFENAVDKISTHANNIDTMFCQWTVMPRYSFSVGLELWSTHEGIAHSARSKEDVNLSDGTRYPREYLDNLLDQLLALHHLHGEILKVVRYTNILKKLADTYNIKIYFINGLCPWDKDYFIKMLGPDITPENFTTFTKTTILDIKNRDDSDIFKLYNKIHNDYNHEGGIDPTNWINLYDSMGNNKIDTNLDKRHPGIKSNQLYFQQIKNFLETR